jgi:hypothetical protein
MERFKLGFSRRRLKRRVVNAFSVFKDILFVGGNFRVTGTGLFVDRIAKLERKLMEPNVNRHDDNVKALYTNIAADTFLYSGGEYSSAGGKWSYHTAMWSNFSTVTVSGLARYADNGNMVLSGLVKIIRMDVITKEIIVVDSAAVVKRKLYFTKGSKKGQYFKSDDIPG